MEVKNPRCTFLTNREVLSVLQQAKAKSTKQKHMFKHNTIVFEADKYLKSTPAASQNEEVVKKLMTELSGMFKLTAPEILQIVNLRPKSNVELSMIIEEAEERYSDEKMEEILQLILSNLPDTEEVKKNGNAEKESAEQARDIS